MKKIYILISLFLFPAMLLAYGVKGAPWLAINANQNYTLTNSKNYYHHPKIKNWITKGGQIIRIQYTNDKGHVKTIANILVAKNTANQGNPQDGAMQLYVKCFECPHNEVNFMIKDNLCYEASSKAPSGQWGKASGCFERVD
ncbi:hypothetical protein AAIR98_000532 [Elusimicrobium simillimum]|uniref:hypothetical protein n=1 Tax=Elusimicrobium simillimum TaxID=3143438 RepID=UPI003C6EDAA1